MSIKVDGVLLENARKVTRVNGGAFVVLRINAGAVFPFEVAKEYGDRPEDHVRAGSVAWDLRAGMRAAVTARQIHYRNDHDIAAMVLREPVEIVVDGSPL